MITIKIFRAPNNRIVRFEVRGHAGFAPEGEDIVCAGVSMVAQTALLGLMNHLARKPRFDQNKGYLWCELPSGLEETEQEKAQVILTTMEAGLVALEAGYPEYVRVLKEGGVNDV